MNNLLTEEKILSVDIGGSHIKATMLTAAGAVPDAYRKLPTPVPATPEKVLEVIQDLVRDFSGYTKVAVGFPGIIRQGCVFTAPNLGTGLWQHFDLQSQLSQVLGKPVRVVNDADLQGLGVVKGRGFEMVITLGTGFGTSLLLDGRLLPHLEMAHHPVAQDLTYDQYIGEKAFRTYGEEEWNKRMEKVLAILKTVFGYDHLYISGGNARQLRFPLDDNVTVVSNREGITGGLRLWQQQYQAQPRPDEDPFMDVLYSTG
jgi:polyphosphate glucokinase